MITGANTNVRYRGILFHVQTEDSGRANPHIISHLYHGGTILGSQKTDYSEHLESDELLGIVKAMIDEQHAEMVGQLKNGGFDEVIQERLGDEVADEGLETQPPLTESPATAPEEISRSEPQPERAPKPDPTASESPGLDTEVEAQVKSLSGQAPEPDEARVFGEGAGSNKPLDEVILDYLCDKARERAGARPVTSPANARANRSEG